MCWFNLKFSKKWYIKVTYTMTSSFIEVKVAANCKLFLAFLQHNIPYIKDLIWNFFQILQPCYKNYHLVTSQNRRPAHDVFSRAQASGSQETLSLTVPLCSYLMSLHKSRNIEALACFTFNHICLMTLFLCQLEQTYLHIFMGYVAYFKLCNSVLCTSVSWLLYFW